MWLVERRLGVPVCCLETRSHPDEMTSPDVGAVWNMRCGPRRAAGGFAHTGDIGRREWVPRIETFSDDPGSVWFACPACTVKCAYHTAGVRSSWFLHQWARVVLRGQHREHGVLEWLY